MNAEAATLDVDVREDLDPTPEGELTLRLMPNRSDTNVHGDISAGWVVAHMDQAAESVASRLAHGRIANIALEEVTFLSPIRVGAAVCFYTRIQDIGSSSIRIAIEVWTQNPNEFGRRKVVDAIFVYVAIDDHGRIRRVPR